jgi:hypothetical protein
MAPPILTFLKALGYIEAFEACWVLVLARTNLTGKHDHKRLTDLMFPSNYQELKVQLSNALPQPHNHKAIINPSHPRRPSLNKENPPGVEEKGKTCSPMPSSFHPHSNSVSDRLEVEHFNNY